MLGTRVPGEVEASTRQFLHQNLHTLKPANLEVACSAMQTKDNGRTHNAVADTCLRRSASVYRRTAARS